MNPRWTTTVVCLSLGVALLGVRATPARAGDNQSFREALREEVEARGIPLPEGFSKAVDDGTMELRAANYMLAARHLGSAYELSRTHPLPPFLIGLACIGLGEYERADKFFLYALQLWPRLPRARPDLSAWLMDRAEYDRLALGLENELFSRKPGEEGASRLLFLAGLFQAFGGDASRARKYLLAVPEGAAPRAAAQLIALSLPEPASASAPRDDGLQRGNRLFVEGRYLDAAHAFGAAAARDPSNSLAFFELGHALFAAGYWRHAARALSAGLDNAPRWPDVDMDRPSFYPEARRGDFREQMDRLKAWTAGHPEDGAAHFLLGYNLYFSKDRPASRAAFLTASRNGWSARASAFLARLDGKTPEDPGPETPPAGNGEDPAAKPPPPDDDGDNSPAPLPFDPLALGEKHLKRGDYARAVEAFMFALADRSSSVAGMTGLGAAWFGKGAFGNAAHWVRMAFRADPENQLRMEWTTALDTADFEKRRAALAQEAEAILDRIRDGQTPSTSDKDLLFLHGYTLYRLGEKDTAAQVLQEILLESTREEGVDAEAKELFLRIRE